MDARNSIPVALPITPENTPNSPINQKPIPTGNVVQRLADALQQRWKSIVHVIDEALQSESLKDRIWAVEQLLKRLKPDSDATPTPSHPNTPPLLSPKQLQRLSDDELMTAIEGYLTPSSESQTP
ncbi:MAG: hypothetical protein QE263_02505 [Vampirovibrionales bacterium]|nr:hypothetical protein [Vampirovibrionales bacterium]